jgi:AcrR family transcriptional regulator
MAQRKPHSSTRRDMVSGRILEQAAALFAERGVSGTSLQEVADALGISRTALYHYIGGKDELLATLVSGLSGETADSFERIAKDRSLEPLEKLRGAVRDMAIRIANNPARFRLLLLSESQLTEPLASEHQKARRRALDALCAIVSEGVRAGVLRPVDARVAAFAVLGMTNWVAWWYRADREGGHTPDELADELADIGLEGLRAAADRGAPVGMDAVGHAIHLLKQDVGFLEQTLVDHRDVSAPRARSRRAAGARSRRSAQG